MNEILFIEIILVNCALHKVNHWKAANGLQEVVLWSAENSNRSISFMKNVKLHICQVTQKHTVVSFLLKCIGHRDKNTIM